MRFLSSLTKEEPLSDDVNLRLVELGEPTLSRAVVVFIFPLRLVRQCSVHSLGFNADAVKKESRFPLDTEGFSAQGCQVVAEAVDPVTPRL